MLEAFIVEAGYSSDENGMPSAVRESVGRKYESIMQADYGYVTLALQQIEGYAEEETGRLWPVATIKEAHTREIGKSFREIVAEIETFIVSIGGVGYSPVITYCYGCRSLAFVHARGPYLCPVCERPLL